MNAWQKCPVCEGSGHVLNMWGALDVCPTCEGKRIIGVLDGKPPTEMKETP